MHLSLLQHRHKLFYRKLLLHGKILRPLQGRFCRNTNLPNGPVLAWPISEFEVMKHAEDRPAHSHARGPIGRNWRDPLEDSARLIGVTRLPAWVWTG
jgi:hypothetical protein